MQTMPKSDQPTPFAANKLRQQIERWAIELGFTGLGFGNTDRGSHALRYKAWLADGFHGDMDYMARNQEMRCQPENLVEKTCCIISVRMNYLSDRVADSHAILASPEKAFVSRYALGRDYHKLMRKRLQQLATKIEHAIGPFGYRAFVDSAPVLERATAEAAGLGWIGKNTNLINRKAGSWFFLGEIFTDLPLPADKPSSNHCGSCSACLDVCPSKAFSAPYRLDARKCISYLTIEHKGTIAEDLRPLIGNRIFGCDDCQLVCPWNRFAQHSPESDYAPRHRLDEQSLIELFGWTENQFLERTAGSPIRRIGYQRWLRNLAIGLGNAPYQAQIVQALEAKLNSESELVRSHCQWALAQQLGRQRS